MTFSPPIVPDPEKHAAINTAVVANEMRWKAYAELMKAAALSGEGAQVTATQEAALLCFQAWLDALAVQHAYQAAEVRRMLRGGT